MTQREIQIEQGGHRFPFSKGLITETLVTAGAEVEAAAALARRLEQHLLDQGRRVLSPDDLKAELIGLAAGPLGAGVAGRLAQQTAAFEDILVGKRPFSRGVLARSLEDTGLPPREAYGVASTVDTRLREQGRRQIPTREVEEEAEQALLERYGERLQLTYRFLRRNRGRIGVIETAGGNPSPFSKGILAKSLLAAGASPDSARKIARATQQRLRGAEDRLVSQAQISETAEELLRQQIGPELADRFRLLRLVRRPPQPVIVLLGGVSGTGKSFLASELAYRLNITRVVSTDSIRQVMRAMIGPALVPTLHASTFNAWEVMLDPGQERPRHPTESQLLAGFREQAQQVSVGVSAIVRRSIEENTSAVLEGVHLVPGFLDLTAFEGAIVVPMLVTLTDEDEHRRHFETRDRETLQHRPAGHYLRYFREIRQLQRYLIDLAGRSGVPGLNGLSFDEAADQAVDVVLRRVLASLPEEEQASFVNV